MVAVAPYYIDTPFLGEWADWTHDKAAQEELSKSARDKKFLRSRTTFSHCRLVKYEILTINLICSPAEAALKIYNTFRAESGSVWLIRWDHSLFITMHATMLVFF